MQLEKWYADSVSTAGVVTVRYLAQLRWGGLRLGYAGGVDSVGGVQRGCWRFGRIDMPRLHADGVEWPALRTNEAPLRYVANSLGDAVTLHRRAQRQLIWQPLVLNGELELESHAARGYVERLSMDFGPWQLGLRRLLWGRFCGQRHGFVWIVWEGAVPFAQSWLDGRAVGAPQCGGKNAVVTAEIDVRWEAAQRLLHEQLGEGSLRALAWLPHAALRQFLRARQTKWHAPARLRIGETCDSGHVIFEEVNWS